MRRVLAPLALAFVIGCGQGERPNNSKVESPGDQPIGHPQGLDPSGSGKGLQLGTGGGTPGGAGLKKVEIKQ